MENLLKKPPRKPLTVIFRIKPPFFILFFAIFFVMGQFCFANGNSVPKWEDFCPEAFLNAKILTREQYCAKFPSLLPPLNSTIKEYNDSVNYWLVRKKHFDEYLKTCAALPAKAQGVCYSKLAESEYAENKKWNDSENARIKKEKDNTNRLKYGEFQRLNNQMRQFGPLY